MGCDDRYFSESEMNEIVDKVYGSPLKQADVCPKCFSDNLFINSAQFKWPDVDYWIICKNCGYGNQPEIYRKTYSRSRYGAVRKWNSLQAAHMRKHYQGQFC